MRILGIFLLILPACWAQSDQAGVEAVLTKMERAQQIGDLDAYKALWTSEKSGELEKLRPLVTAQPDAHYRPLKSFARGDRAVVLAQGYTPGSYLTMMLRREGGEWKIQDQLWRDTAPNPNSVYALVPPDPGAFARAGSPWDQIPPALSESEATRQGWQMKAAFDESYLYIRFETPDELPAPGSTITTPPGGWPVLKIDTSDAGEFVLLDAVNVGDQATFDSNGRADSHRAFAAYMIRLERKDREIFSATAGTDPSLLLDVAGRDYDIRIPLASMGIGDSQATKMTIGDAQWPKSAVVSFAVHRYPR